MATAWSWVRWLFTGKLVHFEKDAVEITPPPVSNSVFSTDIPSPVDGVSRNYADMMEERIQQLDGVQPRVTVTVEPEGDAEAKTYTASAMDHLDTNAGTGTNRLKFDNSQPNVSEAIINFFLNQTFIGHQLAALLSQHWLIRKVCAMPARDAIRHWFEIRNVDGDELDSPEVINRLNRADKKYALRKNLEEYITMGRIFGVRIMIFQVDSTDPNYYELPFNIDGVTPGSYKGMVQVDPYWCAPELNAAAASQPDTQHFYEPTYWLINGRRYHRSHLAIFRNAPPPDILKPSYLYGGIPVPQMVMERIYAAERTANEGPQLAMTKRSTFMKTDMTKVVANTSKFLASLLSWTQWRDNYGVKVLGKDDEMTQVDTALGDLDTVIMTQYQLVASAGGVPATKLLGTQPKGFSATGEFDESSYHEDLESIQTNDITEPVERHHMLVMRSDVYPAMLKKDPSFELVETSISWEALDSPTAKEYAEINLIKAQEALALTQTGGIDGYDVRDRLAKDPNGNYVGMATAVRPGTEDADGEGGVTPGIVGAANTTAQADVDKAQAGTGQDSADGVLLVTNQSFLDPAIVQAKRDIGDYDVQVSPLLTDPITGRMFRFVIDGHHSLAAARADGHAPNLQEAAFNIGDYRVA